MWQFVWMLGKIPSLYQLNYKMKNVELFDAYIQYTNKYTNCNNSRAVSEWFSHLGPVEAVSKDPPGVFHSEVSFYVKLESKKWSPWYSFGKDHARTLRDPACKKGLLQDFIASFLLGLSFFTKSNINRWAAPTFVPLMTSWVLSHCLI